MQRRHVRAVAIVCVVALLAWLLVGLSDILPTWDNSDVSTARQLCPPCDATAAVEGSSCDAALVANDDVEPPDASANRVASAAETTAPARSKRRNKHDRCAGVIVDDDFPSIFYLKVPKTGSTSLKSALMRHAHLNGLRPYPHECFPTVGRTHVVVPAHGCEALGARQVDVMFEHSYFNREYMCDIVGESARWFTSTRHPLYTRISMLNMLDHDKWAVTNDGDGVIDGPATLLRMLADAADVPDAEPAGFSLTAYVLGDRASSVSFLADYAGFVDLFLRTPRLADSLPAPSNSFVLEGAAFVGVGDVFNSMRLRCAHTHGFADTIVAALRRERDTALASVHESQYADQWEWDAAAACRALLWAVANTENAVRLPLRSEYLRVLSAELQLTTEAGVGVDDLLPLNVLNFVNRVVEAAYALLQLRQTYTTANAVERNINGLPEEFRQGNGAWDILAAREQLRSPALYYDRLLAVERVWGLFEDCSSGNRQTKTCAAYDDQRTGTVRLQLSVEAWAMHWLSVYDHVHVLERWSESSVAATATLGLAPANFVISPKNTRPSDEIIVREDMLSTADRAEALRLIGGDVVVYEYAVWLNKRELEEHFSAADAAALIDQFNKDSLPKNHVNCF